MERGWYHKCWYKSPFQQPVYVAFNPLHPNISGHILHTVLYTFPEVLIRRICLSINSFLCWWSFHFFLLTLMFDWSVILWGEIRNQSLWWFKGFKWPTKDWHLIKERRHTPSCFLLQKPGIVLVQAYCLMSGKMLACKLWFV